jgi:hypothetical protein
MLGLVAFGLDSGSFSAAQRSSSRIRSTHSVSQYDNGSVLREKNGMGRQDWSQKP